MSRIEIFREQVVPHLGFDPTDWLKRRGFFKAPASTKYHGATEGGLFDHSYAVMHNLVYMTKALDLTWERPESPYIVGIFHDLCKIDQYQHPLAGEDHACNGDSCELFDTSKWEYNPDTLFKGYGVKSVLLLSTLTQLTEEEVACITYHMGAFTDKEEWKDYTRAVNKYPNVLWTHTADMLAAHVVGT